jgi:protein-S-isoprenylcysteine O-methyltransferase Ste14
MAAHGGAVGASRHLGRSDTRQMVRAKTAVDVRTPTTEIMTSSVFQFSRNPIYLGMVLLSFGVAARRKK